MLNVNASMSQFLQCLSAILSFGWGLGGRSSLKLKTFWLADPKGGAKLSYSGYFGQEAQLLLTE